MSDIYGKGWGDDHDWKRGGSNQVGNNYMLKGSYYGCRNCGASFMHSYDLIPDIFQAMQHVGISEHCPEATGLTPEPSDSANAEPLRKLATPTNKGKRSRKES